jgi:hypothetical protein
MKDRDYLWGGARIVNYYGTRPPHLASFSRTRRRGRRWRRCGWLGRNLLRRHRQAASQNAERQEQELKNVQKSVFHLARLRTTKLYGQKSSSSKLPAQLPVANQNSPPVAKSFANHRWRSRPKLAVVQRLLRGILPLIRFLPQSRSEEYWLFYSLCDFYGPSQPFPFAQSSPL